MSPRTDRSRWLRGLAAGLLAGGLALGGCAEKSDPEAAPKEDAPAAATEAKKAEPAPAAHDARHQAFADAVRSSDNPPPDADRPPDETVSKKPVHRILESVRGNWDAIRFTTPAGKKITYTALVETSDGPMQIALFRRPRPEPRPQLHRPGQGRLLRPALLRVASATSRTRRRARKSTCSRPAARSAPGETKQREHRLLAQAGVHARRQDDPRGGHRRRVPRRRRGHGGHEVLYQPHQGSLPRRQLHRLRKSR